MSDLASLGLEHLANAQRALHRASAALARMEAAAKDLGHDNLAFKLDVVRSTILDAIVEISAGAKVLSSDDFQEAERK